MSLALKIVLANGNERIWSGLLTPGQPISNRVKGYYIQKENRYPYRIYPIVPFIPSVLHSHNQPHNGHQARHGGGELGADALPRRHGRSEEGEDFNAGLAVGRVLYCATELLQVLLLDHDGATVGENVVGTVTMILAHTGWTDATKSHVEFCWENQWERKDIKYVRWRRISVGMMDFRSERTVIWALMLAKRKYEFNQYLAHASECRSRSRRPSVYCPRLCR